MIATPSNLARSLGLLVVSVILILSQGCTQSQPTLPQTHTLPPTLTSTIQQAEPTPTSFFPTATVPVPTITQTLPTSTSFVPTNPEGALVRLSLGSVEQIALSPSGDKVVAVGATHICLYDTANFKQIWCTPSSQPMEYEKWDSLRRNNEKFVSTIVFQPDGNQIIYTLWYGAIIFLDGTTGQRLNVIDAYQQNTIYRLVWSQDSDHLIIWSSQGGVDVWNIAAGEKDGHVEIDPTQIVSVAWTPDGITAAISLRGVGVISLWDMRTLEQIGSLDTELPEYNYKLALSPDGTKLYASVYTRMGACGAEQGDEGWIKAWDITTSELIFDTDMHGACMPSMSVSPDGRWLAGITGYGKLKVLSASYGHVELDLPYNFFKSLVWWGSDRFLFVHYSYPNQTRDLKSIGMLDMDTQWITPIFLPGFEAIYSLAWLPNSDRLVTNSTGGTISIWGGTTGQRLEQFQVTLEGVSLTDFSPASISPADGTLAIPAKESVATIDLESRQVLKTMEYDSTWPETHAAYTRWSRDGKRLAALEYGLGNTNIVVWDVSSGKPITIISKPLEAHISIWDLALSPDGSKLAFSEWAPGEYRLLIYDIEAKKEIAYIKTLDSSRRIIWINQNQVALANHGLIDIYDLLTGTKLRTLTAGSTYAISPDKALVAAEYLSEGITISDFNSGKVLAEFKLEPVSLNDLAISPDGKLLAGLTEYGSVIIWDISLYATH
jgi:WD40 repeat protein